MKISNVTSSSVVALAEQFDGPNGTYFVADCPFLGSIGHCYFYFDAKHSFRFDADVVDVPSRRDIQISRMVRRAGSHVEYHLEDGDLEYLEQNISDYFFVRDAQIWRGAVAAAFLPAAVLFGWRLR